MALPLAEAIALPPEKAIAWFRAKGYAISWNWQETLQEANARAFTVAKVTNVDLLKTIRQALDQALAEGKSERWFQQTLTPVLQKAGWWGSFKTDRADGGEQTVRLGSPQRLRLIYRQNLQSAYMAGRWQEQARLALSRPYLQYVAVMDARTRPSHAALNGKVYRFDDPIWQTHYPPNGWGCRCRVRQLSEFALKKRGLTVSSSEGQLVKKMVTAGTDYETGLVTRTEITGVRLRGLDGRPIEFWTDPGFSFNAGQSAFVPELDRYPLDTARQFVKGVVTGPEFERWESLWRRAVGQEVGQASAAEARTAVTALTGESPAAIELRQQLGLKTRAPRQSYPVAVLGEADQALLGSTTRTVEFSTDSLIEHIAAHPEIGLADYQRVQEMIDEGEVYQQGDQRFVILSTKGRTYRAAIKVDKARQRLFLTSLHIVNESTAKAVRSKLVRVR